MPRRLASARAPSTRSGRAARRWERWQVCRSASRTTCARAACPPPAPPRSSPATCRLTTRTWSTRLLAEDAVPIGKCQHGRVRDGLVQRELGLWRGQEPLGSNRVLRAARRAAAQRLVAARLAPLALGSDTGGSVRQPARLLRGDGHQAHLRPRFALRPGRLRLVARPGRSAGARRARRCAAAVGDRRPRQSRCHQRGARPRVVRRGLRQVRQGATRSASCATRTRAGNEPSVNSAFERSLEAAGGAGRTAGRRGAALASSTRWPPTTWWRRPRPRPTWRASTACASGCACTGSDLTATYGATRTAGFGPEVQRRIMLGTYALSAGYYEAFYLKAQKVRTLIARDYARRLREAATCWPRPRRPPPPSSLARRPRTRCRCTWPTSTRCRPAWPASPR